LHFKNALVFSAHRVCRCLCTANSIADAGTALARASSSLIVTARVRARGFRRDFGFAIRASRVARRASTTTVSFARSIPRRRRRRSALDRASASAALASEARLDVSRRAVDRARRRPMRSPRAQSARRSDASSRDRGE
jgi:hypothetical protein